MNVQPVCVQLSLDGDNQSLKRRSKRYQVPVRFTRRDLDVLLAIYAFGGVLTTVQLALLFWPPDLERRLAAMGTDEATRRRWLASHSPAKLSRALELAKWLANVARVLKGAGTKTDERLAAYVTQQNSEVIAQLVVATQALAAMPATLWMEQQLGDSVAEPTAFDRRPRQPSDFVSSACKARLRALADAGVIEPYEQATRLAEGRAQNCWFLTKSGRNLVAQLLTMPERALDFRPAGAYGTLHLGHRLALNDVRIAMELASAHKGYRVLEWIDDNQLKRLLGKENVGLVRLERTAEGGTREVEQRHALKIPDGYFRIEFAPGVERACFVEFDNQTLTLDYAKENGKDFAQKVRTLSAFYRSGRYKEVFPQAGESMWLLTITSGSERRQHNLKATTERLLGRGNRALDRYWFARKDEIPTYEDYFATAVFSPIWLRGGQDKRWALDE
jgi:hypothetical protein